MFDDSSAGTPVDESTRHGLADVTIGGTANARGEHRRLGIGERVAGFEVRKVLGRGAMGVVYEAWDPTLERRVALKLLRSPSQRAADRLLREARALARLDHSGVVKIWAADVHQGSVYIAMEFIEGQSLREWMRTSRSWREVLPVMIGAASGLAAAHAAGVIHRDFKPDNVLVSRDGQARVLDFGIARLSASRFDSTPEDEPSEESELGVAAAADLARTVPSGDEQLTEDGALIGTLSYMAPELHESEPADERSDQFAFCTTLFEVLYGQRPFPVMTPYELESRVREGRVSYPEGSQARVPRWLERVVLRGLAPAPSDRFDTMDDLIAALERPLSRRRRRNQVLGGVAVAGVAVSLGLLVPRADPRDACLEVGRAIDGALGDEARARIVDRIAELDRPWARRMGKRVDEALDSWTGRWVEARTEVCRARHAHREATILDRRREACLDRQLDQVGALGAVLTEASVRTLSHAERTLTALPDPQACVDDPPAERPELEGAAEALDRERKRLVWLALAGGDSQVRQRAEQLVAEARGLRGGASLWLVADALIVLANVEIVDGDLVEAEQHLHEAARTAERIEADAIRARAVVDLGWTLARLPGRADEAVVVLEDADALLIRTGNPSFERQRQRQALGEALLASGELARARTVFEVALAEDGRTDQAGLHRATSLLGLSRVASAEGNHGEALEHAQQAVELVESKVGGDHPIVAASLTNVGLARDKLGDEAAARAAFERALAVRRLQLDDEGTPGNRRLLAEVLLNLANLDSRLGHSEAAAASYSEALALVPEDDAAARALILFNLGVDHQLAGRAEEALANYREALRLAEQVHPFDSPVVVAARLGVGSMLAVLGRPAEARVFLERSLADWPSAMADSPDEGELRFGLARVLTALEGWSSRSEELAREARAIYGRAKLDEPAAEVDAWIAGHGRARGR